MGHQSGRGKGRITRASVQFRGQEPPLLRVKLPVSGFFGAPLFAGCTVGGSPADLALHLGTLGSEGPSLRLTYRPVAAGSSLPASAAAALAVAPLLTSEAYGGGEHGRTDGSGPLSAAAAGGIGTDGQEVRDSESPPGSVLAVLKAGLGRRGAAAGAALSLRLEVDLLRPAASRLLFKLQPCFGDASIQRFPTSGLPSACSISSMSSPAQALAVVAASQGASPSSGPMADNVSSISEQPGPASGLQAVAAKTSGSLNGFRALPHTQSSPTPLASSPSSCASLPTRVALAPSAPHTGASSPATSSVSSGPSQGAPVQEAGAPGAHAAPGATAQGSWLQGVGVGQIGRWVQRKRREQGWGVAMHSTVPLGSAGLLRARWRLHLPGEPLHLPLSLGQASFRVGPEASSGMAEDQRERVGELASLQEGRGATSLSPQVEGVGPAGVTITGCPVLLLDKLSLVLHERPRRSVRQPAFVAKEALGVTGPGLAGGAPWSGALQAPESSALGGCACPSSSAPCASQDGGAGLDAQKQDGGAVSTGDSKTSSWGGEGNADKAVPSTSGPHASSSSEPASSKGGWRLWGRQKKKGGGALQERGKEEKGKGQAASDLELPASGEWWGQAQAPERGSLVGAVGGQDGGFLGLQEEPWEAAHAPSRKSPRASHKGADSGRADLGKRSTAPAGRDVSEELRLAILHAQQR